MQQLYRPSGVPPKMSFLAVFRKLEADGRKLPTLLEIDEHFGVITSTSQSRTVHHDLRLAARTLLVCPDERKPLKRGSDIFGSGDMLLPFSHLNPFDLPETVFAKDEVYLLVTPFDIKTEGLLRKQWVIYPERIEVLDYSAYLNIQFNRLFGIEGKLDPDDGLPSATPDKDRYFQSQSPRRQLCFSGCSRSDIFCLVMNADSYRRELTRIVSTPVQTNDPYHLVDVATLISVPSTPYR